MLNLSACSSDDTADTPTNNIIVQTEEPADAAETSCDNVNCESNNKILVEQVFNDVINSNDTGPLDFLVHETILQDSINFYAALTANKPDHIATIKHIVADGDYVAVHWHYSNTPENDFTESARVDLYKITDNQIIERINFSMQLSGNTASGNSVFSNLYDYGTDLPNNDVAIEEENKIMVSDFYAEAFNNLNLEVIDELVDENYIQHNPFVPNGRDGLRNFVSSFSASANISIFLTLAEDDLVWTFRSDSPVVDLWRVDNNTNKIVEHWDVF
jgi:predicted SnoaL-like aldol condensation-catalyzing enzyme